MNLNKLIHTDAWKIDRVIGAYGAQGRFNGAALLAFGSQVLYRKGHGLADFAHRVPCRPNTAFHVGSMTKPFTALAILQLHERAALSVHDAVDRYLPGYPHGSRITLHHLLTNTSGIPDYVTQDAFARQMALPIRVDDLIAGFRERELLFAPGERFSYSNSNWVLLGAIVERVAGESYGSYLRHAVFEPAGMSRSGYSEDGAPVAGLAQGYVQRDERVLQAAAVHPSQLFAAGGIYSTVDDLHRWDRALRRNALLAPATAELMHTPHAQADEAAYGYGWVIDQVWGRRRIWHDGGMPGYLGIIARYPDDGAVAITLANFENAAFTEIERTMAAIAFGQPYAVPDVRTFTTVDPAAFAPLIGKYDTRFAGRSVTLQVLDEGGALFLEASGLPRARMQPMSPTRYFTQLKGEVELEFATDGSQPAREIAITWAGHPITAKRIG